MFWRYACGSIFFMSYGFAYYATDFTYMQNQWYNRPDFRPFPAMVEESTDFDQTALNQVWMQNYGRYKNIKNNQIDEKKNFYSRFFRPLTANYDTRVNLYHGREPTSNYYQGQNGGGFPMLNTDNIDHV